MSIFNKKSENNCINNLKVYNIEDYQEEKLVLEKEQLLKERRTCKYGSIISFGVAAVYGGAEAIISGVYDVEYPLEALIVVGIALLTGIYSVKSIFSIDEEILNLDEKIEYAQKIKRR